MIQPVPFIPFELETYRSQFEHTVEYNLADSSVKCVTTREWLNEDEIEMLLDTGLYYSEVNDTRALRQRIAALYPGVDASQILVTVGASSVLVAPGAFLGEEHHLRITLGYEPEKVRTALGRIGEVVAELAG